MFHQANAEGNVAIIDYDDTVRVRWIKISEYDRSLRRLKDIGIYRESLLNSNGINTIDDLLNCTDDFLRGLKTRLLTPLELKEILSVAENKEEELILTLLFKYGLSVEELEKLTLYELDPESNAIHFRKSHGKGEKRLIFLDDETYCQLYPDYHTIIKNQFYRNHDPIFKKATIDGLYIKLHAAFNSFNESAKLKGGIGKRLGKELIERARAYHNNEPLIYSRVKSPENIIYVDIETSPIGIESSLGFGEFYMYLIGVYGKENGYQSFITKERKPDEKKILKAFLSYLKGQKEKEFMLCAYNGHKFDFKCLDEKICSNKLGVLTYRKITKIDLLEICRRNIYVPKGYSLMNVATSFGYPFNQKKNGYHMGLEYQGYVLGTLDEPDWEKMIKYNREDILAMEHILERIRLFDHLS